MELSSERIEKLLAMLVLQSMAGRPQKEKALALNLAGFSNVEVADLLQTSSQVISQYLYESRRKGNKALSAKAGRR